MNIKQILRGVFSLLMFVVSSSLNIYSQADALVNVKYAEEVLTVGGPDADIAGYSSEAIQIALHAIKSRGGGTVKLYPGVFHIMAPVRLSSNTTFENIGVSRESNGFYIDGETHDINIKGNIIRSTGKGNQTGVHICRNESFTDKYIGQFDIRK